MAALAGSDCSGTPLPEPPDNTDELPRPIWPTREILSTGPASVSDRVPIRLDRDAVQPNTEVWAINLDNAQVAPVRIIANANGGFALDIAAKGKERIRILSRTPTQHSAPLDLVISAVEDSSTAPPPPRLVPLIPERVGCLTLRPTETVVLNGTTGVLALNNRCAAPVTITLAQLRLGDQGIALMPAPTEIAAGAETTLTFQDSRGPGATERLDILLLDVDAGSAGRGRYAIDLFSDLDE